MIRVHVLVPCMMCEPTQDWENNSVQQQLLNPNNTRDIPIMDAIIEECIPNEFDKTTNKLSHKQQFVLCWLAHLSEAEGWLMVSADRRWRIAFPAISFIYAFFPLCAKLLPVNGGGKTPGWRKLIFHLRNLSAK